MVSIPDRLHALITSQLTETEGRLQIEIPTELVEQATVNPEEVYQIAILPTETEDAADDNWNTTSQATASTSSSTGERSEPPVTEGEVRTVTIDTLGDQGDGIARVERGFVVIVANAKPDEEVTVRIETVQSNVAFASIIEQRE
ncbi:TRAM domain-containing protein [Halalkalicoccus subterraneus]|uniref:TRAM domain-containing protein n=1 Tax=Halalkalicoccus subterraneus TaxID=2675002 RepID=UPI000EFCA28A|nr:TRAM domain-containing protein [Halalkalicoccus subterraneus]